MIFQKIAIEIPDLFDMTILGSVLHSFYNGLENIFEIIAKNIDENVPNENSSRLKKFVSLQPKEEINEFQI